MLRYVTLCYVMLRYVTLCYVMLRYVTPCYVTLHCTTLGGVYYNKKIPFVRIGRGCILASGIHIPNLLPTYPTKLQKIKTMHEYYSRTYC